MGWNHCVLISAQENGFEFSFSHVLISPCFFFLHLLVCHCLSNTLTCNTLTLSNTLTRYKSNVKTRPTASTSVLFTLYVWSSSTKTECQKNSNTFSLKEYKPYKYKKATVVSIARYRNEIERIWMECRKYFSFKLFFLLTTLGILQVIELMHCLVQGLVQFYIFLCCSCEFICKKK